MRPVLSLATMLIVMVMLTWGFLNGMAEQQRLNEEKALTRTTEVK